MMQSMKSVAGLVVLAAVAGLVTLYSGVIDVGASNPHSTPVRWLLHTAMQRSVAFHAGDIKVPQLDKPQMVMMGFRHYREMCVGCHLAPGMRNSEIRQGLMPRPPVLQKAVPHLTPAELFWVVKHGVKMTGMPAWGATHSDDKIWAIVAFLEQLPKMTPAGYQQMDRKAGPGDGDEDEAHDHTH